MAGKFLYKYVEYRPMTAFSYNKATWNRLLIRNIYIPTQ